MARTFYTERDIEDLAKRGVTEIPVDDSVYITDSAIDLMDKLGIKRKVSAAPAASNNSKPRQAPSSPTNPSSPSSTAETLTDAERQQVIEQVKSGVIARLGPGVDKTVVDQIVRKVVAKL